MRTPTHLQIVMKHFKTFTALLALVCAGRILKTGTHVPGLPHPRSISKTRTGPRGDAMVQFDARFFDGATEFNSVA